MYEDTPTGRMCGVPAGAYVGVDARTHRGMRVSRRSLRTRGSDATPPMSRSLKMGRLHERRDEVT